MYAIWHGTVRVRCQVSLYRLCLIRVRFTTVLRQADVSVVLTDISVVLANEPIVLANEPIVLTDEPVILTDEPVILTDKPVIFANITE